MDIISFTIVDYSVKIGAYSVLVGTILYAAYQLMHIPIRGRYARLKYKALLRKRKIAFMIDERIEKHPLLRHLYFMIQTLDRGNNEQALFSFLLVTVVLFWTSFVVISVYFQDLVVALLMAMFTGLLPYLLLQIRLKNIQNSLGNQLAPIVSEMTQNYNANQYDMYRTLVDTAKHIHSTQIKKVFLRLLSDLQTVRNEDDLRHSIDLFIFTCGNTWSKRLGNIILKAYYYDENIMNALLALNRQMEDTEKMLEEEKSTAMDPVVNGLLTVPIFVVSLILGFYVSGPQEWYQLQFHQSWTVFTFVLMSCLMILSIFISLLLRNPKNDL